MTVPQDTYDDLVKRVEKMNIDECERILDYIPKDPKPIDKVLKRLIEDRIEYLNRERNRDPI